MLPQLEIHTTKDNIKYVLFSQSEIISDEIRANGCWNKHIYDIAANVLEVSPKNGLVIDVGAGIGSFTVPLALTHQDFVFRSFEPLKVIFWQLCSNVLLNNLNNVRMFESVVANETTKKLYFDIDYETYNNHGSFSLNPNVNQIRGIVPIGNNPFNHMYHFLKIDEMTFMNVVLLKISAPGMEIDVLNGARETLKLNNNPPIILEIWSEDWYNNERTQCLELLKELGYVYIHDIGGHVVAFKDHDHFLICNSDAKSIENIGGFKVLGQQNNVADVLVNQTEYNAV